MNQVDLRPLLANGSLPKATTLLRESGLRVLLLHVKAGERIPEHQTNGAITVHCLEGEVSFSAGAEQVSLSAGLLISLQAGSPHSLVGQQDSFLLVTVSEPAPAHP